MDQHGEPRVEVGTSYPAGQLAKAFVTAMTHADDATRKRAEERIQRWRSVLDGMASGVLRVGSREPVAGLPVWVTQEVVRGGFATGFAAASGYLREHEVDTALDVGVEPNRQALFAYYLSEPGLAQLYRVLDSGQYRVEVPEEAALLVVAWLARAGDLDAALTLVEAISPLADRLRFAPAPGDAPASDPAILWRQSVGEIRERVDRRQPNGRIATQREALTVWNPFADELLDLWLDTYEDGAVDRHRPEGWAERAAALLDRYRALTLTHRLCGKHRRPKENLAILRAALEEAVAGRPLAPRQAGLLQHAVDSMVRRRGRPGSAEHAALRARQADEAAQPTHHALARVVVARLAELPQGAGTRDVEELCQPVREGEAADVPAGTAIPKSIEALVRQAFAGTIEELVERRVVPSAEVLARLVPQIAATTTTLGYADESLRALMAANYRAFRSRRSLLLLNLEHQVRLDELPWVQAVDRHRRADDRTQEQSSATLVRLGELALTGFPATVLPNPLVRELAALGAESGVSLPWVEELAADIFMGRFSAKFLAAAKIAGDLLDTSLYARYYGIDYAAIQAIDDVSRDGGRGARTSGKFDALCHERADGGHGGRRSHVAANGVVIEQAQILTTHNLATLAGPVGVQPADGWLDLARRAWRMTCTLVRQLDHNPRPLSTVKDAAYAWRQMVFYLSLTSTEAQAAFVGQAAAEVDGRLAPAIAGLQHVLAGGSFDGDGTGGGGRRFLGWTVRPHWLLASSAAVS